MGNDCSNFASKNRVHKSVQVVTRTPRVYSLLYTHVYCSFTYTRLAKTVARAGIGTNPTRSNHRTRIITEGNVRLEQRGQPASGVSFACQRLMCEHESDGHFIADIESEIMHERASKYYGPITFLR